MQKVSRRGFLNKALVGIALSYALTGLAGGARGKGDPRLEHMRTIGRAYLAEHPVEGRALLSELRDSGVSPEDPTTAEALIREDFRRGRTVAVKGWVLSSTEAKLCALIAQG